MKRKLFIVIALVSLFLLQASNIAAVSATTISVEDTIVAENEEIAVPIKITNNAGVCGATISISYDNSLVLNRVDSGSALSSLVMTKPGDLAANPFNIVFDGIEEDNTNGVIAYLYFNGVPESGTYDISVTYKDGDIVNGNLEPLEIQMVNGQVIVGTGSGGETDDHDGPVITVGKVTANPGSAVDVPVYISGNTGICGATMKITYDEALTLTQITKGNALNSLVMTKPGNMAANPFNLVFDGIEEDNTNGVFFTLTFTAPQSTGLYDIAASYEAGDIVDGSLIPVDVLIETGSIAVGDNNIEVMVDDQIVHLPGIRGTDGNVFVAFYNALGRMTSVKLYGTDNPEIYVVSDTDAKYAKVLCWSDALIPLCEAQKITLK